MAVSMKSTIFWNVTPCSLIFHQHLGGTYTAAISRIEEFNTRQKNCKHTKQRAVLIA
jgi:hypothetical protein